MNASNSLPSHFRWLNLTQALGSFMDNLFKMLTVFYLAGPLKMPLGLSLGIATVLLVAPFLLFSNLAGALADRYSKTSLVRIVKAVELALVLLAFPALFSGRAWPMLSVLALLTTQSSFFGPLKRGIIPELVPEESVAEANGRMTAASYLGIIAGMALPSALLTLAGLDYAGVLGIATAVSALGLAASFGLPRTEAKRRPMRVSARIVSDTLRVFRAVKERRPMLRQAMLGSVAVTGLAALFQQVLVVFAKEHMGLSVEASGFAFLFVAGGMALGSRLAGRYSARALDAGSIPFGVLLTTLALAALPLLRNHVVLDAALVLVGLGGGLCLVPLTTYLQTGADPDRRGEVLGAEETASFAAIIVSAGVAWLLSDILHASATGLVLATAAYGAALTAWALRTLPRDSFRFGLSRLCRLLYRVRVEGVENVPMDGAAMLAMNHTAFCDAPIVQSVLPRRLRFVMSREVFSSWTWCRAAFRANGAIPIHATDSARDLVRSIGSVREALREGDLVGICPEGTLTPTGRIEAFKPGIERMTRGTDAPVIPVYIGNLWGSMFSHARGAPGLKLPSHLGRRTVLVRIGRPMPRDCTAEEVRAAVMRLGNLDGKTP